MYGSMSLLDKISNGIVIALIQHFHPDHCTPVDCPTARYYRYLSAMIEVPLWHCFIVEFTIKSTIVALFHCRIYDLKYHCGIVSL